jgi:hypothetical protein
MATKDTPGYTRAQFDHTVRYCQDPSWKSHEGKTLLPPKFHLVESMDELVRETWDQWRRYELLPLRRNRGSKSPFSVLIYRVSNGADLNEGERAEIVREILAKVAPNSAAAIFWHLHADGTADCHILVMNVQRGSVPRLRKAEFGAGGENYYRVLHQAENEAVARINAVRSAAGRPLVDTVADARWERLLEREILPLEYQLRNLEDETTAENFVRQMAKLGHAVLSRHGLMAKVLLKGARKPTTFNIARQLGRVSSPRPLVVRVTRVNNVDAPTARQEVAARNSAKMTENTVAAILTRSQKNQKIVSLEPKQQVLPVRNPTANAGANAVARPDTMAKPKEAAKPEALPAKIQPPISSIGSSCQSEATDIKKRLAPISVASPNVQTGRSR